MIDIEEVAIDEEELEVIEKELSGYDFPVATLGKQTIYFNRHAVPLIPEFLEWRTSPQYIVGLPTTKENRNSFHVRRTKNARDAVQATFPVKMRNEKMVKSGSYRIYKYKDGFCFKRYERLSDTILSHGEK